LDFSGKNILVKESINFVKVEHDVELEKKYEKVTLVRNSFDHKLSRPPIADRQIKTTYLADVTEEFVKKFNK
jgi:hypothetical protein